MSEANKNDMLRVGVIINTHGIKGEVKVFPTTDDISRFDDLETVYIDLGREKLKLTVEGVKYFKGQPIVKFKEFNNINDVERFKQKDLLVDREDAVELSEGEYFICDILGFSVYSDEQPERLLGKLTDVLETGANNVFVVEKPDGKEILIPRIPDCIGTTIMEEKKIIVHLLPGLDD